jgi:hypothetical protein
MRANGGAVIVTATDEKHIAQNAMLEADSWVAEAEAKCRQVLSDHNAAGEYIPSRVRLLLMQAVRSYIGPAPSSELFAARGRPMKISNREAYRAWERSKLPYLRQVRVDLAAQNMRGLRDYVKDRTLPPAAREEARQRLADWKRYAGGKGKQPERITGPRYRDTVLTADSRRYNAALVRGAVLSPEVVYLLWTNYPELSRSGQSCEYCENLNGLTVPKGSDFVGTNSPPIHPNCHCRWFRIEKKEVALGAIKATPKREYPEGEPAEGWGGYAPKGAAKKGR